MVNVIVFFLLSLSGGHAVAATDLGTITVSACDGSEGKTIIVKGIPRYCPLGDPIPLPSGVIPGNGGTGSGTGSGGGKGSTGTASGKGSSGSGGTGSGGTGSGSGTGGTGSGSGSGSGTGGTGSGGTPTGNCAVELIKDHPTNNDKTSKYFTISKSAVQKTFGYSGNGSFQHGWELDPQEFAGYDVSGMMTNARYAYYNVSCSASSGDTGKNESEININNSECNSGAFQRVDTGSGAFSLVCTSPVKPADNTKPAVDSLRETVKKAIDDLSKTLNDAFASLACQWAIQ